MANAKLLLVDGHALAYRAHYALGSLCNSRSEPTGALYGFIQTLRKYIVDHQPTHLAVAFDLGAPARLKDLPTYKIQRPPTPEDLEKQIPQMKSWLAASRIPILEQESYEADDIIATVVAQASPLHWQCLIATNDKDLCQLVNEKTQILLPLAKGKKGLSPLMDRAAVQSRYGIEPSQIVDYISLIGDSVDNIPGIPGIGPKTASQLLRQFGTLQILLQRLDDIPNKNLRQKISDHVELLRRNRALITLRTDVPLDVSLEALKISAPDYDRLIPILERLEFKSLLATAQAEAKACATADSPQQILL